MRAEQIRVVYQQAPPAQLLSIIAVALLCWMLWDESDRGRLVIWFVTLTAITLSRVALAVAFHRANPTSARMADWELAFLGSLTLVSLAWGVGGLLVMPPSSPLHTAMVYFFLMGVAGGAVASYSAHAAASVIAVASIMLPATIALALRDSAPLRAMAAGGLLYVAAAARSTRTLGFFLRRAFQLQFELHQGYSHARQQAHTDELTGLANRRAFVEQGRAAIDQSLRYERPLSLVMFDIDHFKQINDQHGHACGDEALRRVAGILRGAARVSDLPGRIGGEEFAVLLPETSMKEAQHLAERLRREMEALSFTHEDRVIQFTCSFGVAERNPAITGFDALLRAADAALYRAKEKGRNRVSLAV